MTKEAGKGDTYRQVVWDKYSTGYDNIFNKNKVRVSGVPYEVELQDVVAELERENFMLRARMERLEDETRTANELLNKMNIQLINEQNKNASGKR